MHTVDIPAPVKRVLRRMHEGGAFVAERTFPHPHRLKLSLKGGGWAAAEVPDAVIGFLMHHALIEAHPRDARADRIDYTLSAFGKRTALSGTLVYEDTPQFIEDPA